MNGYISNKIAGANNIWFGTRSYESNATDGTQSYATVGATTYARVWRWTAGATESPVAGNVVSQCTNKSPVCDFSNNTGLYSAWNSGEPNNSGVGSAAYSGEWAAVTNWSGTLGSWNDLSPTSTGASGYVVEFGGKTNTDSSLGTGFAGVVTDTSAVTVSNSASVPSAPSITATRGDGQIYLTWTPPADGGAAITSYDVWRNGVWTNNFATTSSDAVVNGNVVTTITADVTGLTNGTTYSFMVRANNSAGTGASSSMTPGTPSTVPAAPTGLTATAGNFSAALSWTASANDGGGGLQSYTVTSTPGGRTCTATGGATSCTVTGLADGTDYTFTVHATNFVGNSAESVASGDAIPAAPALTPSSTPTANQPQHATVVIPSGGSVTLLDGNSNPATTVTVAGEGTYTNNTTTGVITFTPVIGWTGTPDPVTYRVTDSNGNTGTSTFSPGAVTAPAAPVATPLTPSGTVVTNQPQHATAAIPTGGSVTLLDGNSNPATTVTVAGQGTYTLNSGTGVVTFTPVIGYTGTPDVVGYRLTDAYGQSSSSTFAPSAVTAPAGPTTPVLSPSSPAVNNQPQHATITIPSGGSVTLLDGNDDPATTVTVAGQGTYTLDPATGVITFTPVIGFTGTPTPVGYEATDAYGQSNSSTFQPSAVTAPPAPTPPTLTPSGPVVSNQPQHTTAAIPSGGAITLLDSHGAAVTTVTVAGQGTYTLDPATGVITFTPAIGFTGTPTAVTYRVTDAYGQHGSSTFTPGPVTAPAAPVAGPLTPSSPADTNQPQTATATVPTAGAATLLDSHGTPATTVTVAGQGTYTVDATSGVITFTPAIGYLGTPTPVGYRVTDAYGQSSSSTFSPDLVTIPAAPTAPVLPPSAPADTNQPQHATVTIPAGGSVTLLDGNGDPATTVTVPGEGTYTLNTSTGVITFTPVIGFTGTPTPVGYQVTDGYGQSTSSTFAPTDVVAPAAPVAPVLPPSAPADTNRPQHATVAIPDGGSVTLLDGNGDPTTSVTIPGEGAYTLNPSTGVLTFTPDLGYTGTPDPVTYQVTDAYGQSDSSTFQPGDVTPPAPPAPPVLTPTAPADTNRPQSTTAVVPTGGSVTLLDGNGDPATTVVVPGQGSYVLDPATGVITFSPVIGFTGTPDPVGYRITDAYNQSTDSTFAPSPVSEPAGPVAPPVTPTGPSSSNQPQQTTITIPDGGTVTLIDGNGDPATTVTVPDEGTYVLDPATGVVTFTPAPGFSGTPTPAGYQITDAYGQSSTATFAPGVVTLVPASPTGITVVPGNGTATVHFTAPAFDGGLAITGYVVVSSPGGIRTPVDAAGDATVTGLANGTAYTFTVVAINANGQSLGSDSVTTTPRTVPGAPTISGAVAGNGSVTLTVAAPGDNGGAPITGYSVVTSPGGARTPVNADGTVTITGLTNGVPYTFTVVATNVAGDSALSASATATPAATAGAPSLKTLKVGSRWLKVTVVPSGDTGGVVVTGYTVMLSPGGRSLELAGPLGGVVRFTGLKNGVHYTVKAVAHNAAGLGGWSPVLRGTPMTAPGAPKVRTSATITSLTIKLGAPKSNGGAKVRSYRVVVSGPGLRTRTVSLPAKKKSLTVYGLRPHTRYEVVVTAVNAAGRSKARRVGAMTRTAPPGGVPVTQVAGHAIASGTVVSLGGDATLAFDSATLLPSARKLLLTLTSGAHSKRSVTCAGYADFGGDAAHEYTLAQQRASVVCAFLVSHGAAAHTSVVSYGGTRPLVTAGDSAARAQNRRVTITFG